MGTEGELSFEPCIGKSAIIRCNPRLHPGGVSHRDIRDNQNPFLILIQNLGILDVRGFGFIAGQHRPFGLKLTFSGLKRISADFICHFPMQCLIRVEYQGVTV